MSSNDNPKSDAQRSPEVEALTPYRRQHLYARWPRRDAAPWYLRLLGWGPQTPDPPLGSLELTEEGMTFWRNDGLRGGHVAWDRPFSLQWSHWPYEDEPLAEINLMVRSRAHDHGAIALRTVWPTSHVDSKVPRKQEAFPFASPQSVQALWRWLTHCAQLHGVVIPSGLSLEVAPDALAGLRSHNEVFTCVSCGSQDVALLAARVYRCNDCGYEGGDGFAAHEKRQRLLAIERMSERERLLSGWQDLVEARRLLLATNGSMVPFYSLMRGHSSEETLARANEALTLHRDLTEAFEHIEEALVKSQERYGEGCAQALRQLDFVPGSTSERIMANNYRGDVVTAQETIDALMRHNAEFIEALSTK